MRLQLVRKISGLHSTSGELLLGDLHLCFTLEPSSPIPIGIYPLEPYFSPHNDMIVPLLGGVPGHDFIEIHIGNAPKDTQDCILVGESRAQDWVGSSIAAFLRLMLKYIVPAWLRKEPVELVIVEEG